MPLNEKIGRSFKGLAYLGDYYSVRVNYIHIKQRHTNMRIRLTIKLEK